MRKDLYNKLDFRVLMDLETLYKMDYAISYLLYLFFLVKRLVWICGGRKEGML
jgi:hypothetical protein